MKGLLASEWRKITTTRMWIGLVIAAVIFTAINATASALLAGTEFNGQPTPPLTEPSALRTIYATAGSASVMALLLGLLAITGEYRHQTITSTFLATPRRSRVLIAKMTAQAVFGAALGLLCGLTTLLVLLAVLPFRDHAPIDAAGFAAILGGVILGFAIYAVLGVGLGSLIRNQIAAISVALIWVMLVEAVLVGFLPAVGKWLPGGALNGVLQIQSFFAEPYLTVFPAALLLMGYGVAFAAVAALTTLRRDIT